MTTELEALQNFATTLNLNVNFKFTQDKRQTIKKYFLTDNGTSVSPVLGYDQLNCFMIGWSNCIKTKNN